MSSSISPVVAQLHRLQLQAGKLRTVSESEERESKARDLVFRKGFVEKEAGFSIPGVGHMLRQIKSTGSSMRRAGRKAVSKIPTSAKVVSGIGVGAWGGNAVYDSEVQQARFQKFLDQYYAR